MTLCLTGEMKEVNNYNNFSFLSGLDADFIYLHQLLEVDSWLLQANIV